MKATINITLCFFQLLFVCRCHYIQKCCDRKKQLARNFDTCIDFDEKGVENYEYEKDDETGTNMIQVVKGGENDNHGIWWLSPNIKFVSLKSQHSGYKLVEIPFSDLTDIKFSYNTKCPCEPSEREIVPFTDFVFIVENGSLLITNIDDNVRPKTMIYPYSSYCLDRVSFDDTNQHANIVDHSFAILLCPCLYMPCVRMCCKWKHFLNLTKIPETCEHSANISLKWNLRYMDETKKEKDKFPEQFGILQNMPKCEHGVYHLNENSSSRPNKKFWILPDGSISAEGHHFDVNYKDYCIHYWKVNGTLETNLRICKTPYEDTPPPSQFARILYGIYFTVGAFFLALTFLVYGVVKELRTSVHAYYLMAHVFCMFISTSVLAVNEFFWYSFSSIICIGVAYVIQFSFISATLWLNIMCIDISDTFEGYCTSHRFNLPQNGRKLFMRNSVYVWGATLGIAIATAIADNTSVLDKSLRPQFGVKNCWFLGDFSKFIFFYLPVSIAFIHNSYLFLTTARRIVKLQRDSGRLFSQESGRHFGNSSMKRDTHRLMLFAKLFGLMGITWIFEILSWVIDSPSYFWYVTDAVNCLRGLFIFLIFCCKKKVLYMFLNSFLSIPRIIFKDVSSNTPSARTSSSGIPNTNSIQLDVLSSSNRTTTGAKAELNN